MFFTEVGIKSGFLGKLLEVLQDFAMHSGLRLIAAVLTLIIGFKLAKWICKAFERGKAFKGLGQDVQGIARGTIKFLLHLIVIVLVIAILGIPLASVATIISSAAVALGLALQGSLSNLAGGLMILVFKPFHVGHFIEAAGFSGEVETIGVFYTALRTLDNRRVVLPNAALSNANLVNFSVYDTRRVDLTVSAGISSDSEVVKAIIHGVILGEKLALLEPEPFVRLNDCTDGKLNFTVRVWCMSEDYFTLYNDLQEDLREAFVQKGVAPALTKMELHIDK
ncbi:MAG: mechanosensitive ion channel [Christensenellaceae bacterium]|nr:mechanosensitive ion channel [Christensenellaceae bacterium]